MDRQERRRRTMIIIARRKEVMRWSGMLDVTNSRRVGRCRTLHPFDCGCGKRGMCGIQKRKWSGPTRQERKAELTLKEMDCATV